MILEDVFQFLKSAGLAPNHATFSTDYLGHSRRYYDYLRCSGAKPSLRAMLKLAMVLHDIAEGASGSDTEVSARDFARRVMSRALLRCQ